MSNKRARFVRLAEKRMAKAIKTIRAIGALTDKGRYEYDDRDAEKIVVALEAEVAYVKNRFGDESLKKDPAFKL